MKKKISKERIIEFENQSKQLIAVLDFEIEQSEKLENKDFDFKENFIEIKKAALEKIANRNLTIVQRWLRDCTEEREDDFELQNYVFEKTGIKLNLREKLLKRVQKTIERGKINTENQYYDLMNEINYLTQEKTLNAERINLLNNLIIEFENRIEKRKK